MFIYKQSVYDINVNYMNDEFEYSINNFNGQRIEDGNKIQIINSPINLSIDEVKLDISDKEFKKLKSLLKHIKNELQKTSIEFSAILNLHNEKVVINDVSDNRYYGFLRLILKDSSYNIVMEDIPILNFNYFTLENTVLNYIKDYTKNILYKNSNKNQMSFSNIPVILSSQASGFFAHEVLGHGLEEDFFCYAKRNYDELKISKKLSIKDSVENYTDIIGLCKYDDIGTKIKPLTLVEKGKLKNILAINKDKSFDKTLYGFARRQDYKHNVLPRMRGTFILPHDNMNENDILNKYQTAIFINKAYLGGVNPLTGVYNLTGDGFYVKNGEKKNFINNLKLTGNIKNDLSAIEYIGNDFRMFGSYCVKLDQTVRVGMGSPSISLNNMSVEGDIYGNL